MNQVFQLILSCLAIFVGTAKSLTTESPDKDNRIDLLLQRFSDAKHGPMELLAFGANDPEVYMTPEQIINYHGYPVEIHNTTTEDGYDLVIYRLPHGRNNKTIYPNRPVVFLQHGLDGSAADWITNLPNQAAAFVFADAGFDVFLGNFRGNKFAKSHRNLSIKTHAFWQFSWDEMANYDLPAMIDASLQISGQKQLYYVGFSLGATTALAKLSRDLTLTQKIKKIYAMGPIAYASNVKGPLRWIAPLTGTLNKFFTFFGMDEFAPNRLLTNIFARYFCTTPVVSSVCDNILFLIGGPNSHQINATRMPVYMSHAPGGTSTRTMIHIGQMVNSGQFRAYDYGSATINRQHYGTDTPPEYDLTKVNTPVALFMGGQDWLADQEDVQTLISKLKNLSINAYLPDFNHFDFTWGLRASAQVYWPILNDILDDHRVLKN